MSDNQPASLKEIGEILKKLSETRDRYSDREFQILVSLLKEGVLSSETESDQVSKLADIENIGKILAEMEGLDLSVIKSCSPHYTYSYD